MSLTSKQKELVELLSASLPFTPSEIAQKNVEWYKQWKYNETVNIGDRRYLLKLLMILINIIRKIKKKLQIFFHLKSLLLHML